MADGLPDGFEKLIDPAAVEAVLEVRCDDPTHVRGKITKVATFVRVDGYWRPLPRVVATIKNLPDHGAPVPTSAAAGRYRGRWWHTTGLSLISARV